MKIFVISLKNAVQRRASISSQLRSIGLPFEFFDAICGNDLLDEEVRKLVDQKIAYRYEGHILTPGEIGCALSHRAIYKRILDENLPYALILEDDIAIKPELAKIIETIDIDSTLIKHEITLFSNCIISSTPLLRLPIEDVCLHDVKGGYFAHAYIITNRAASKFIRLQNPIKHVADCWGWLLKHRLISIGAVQPVLTEQQRASFGSDTTIGHLDLSKMSCLRLLKHKVSRCWWKLVDIFGLVEYF